MRGRAYFRRFHERFGFLPRSFRQTAPGAVWLHAVSVGEVLSAVELIRGLREALPLAPVFVSSATLAGRAAAEDKLRGLANGVFYAPIDYCFAIRRVLRTLRPRAVVMLETEIWPNLYRQAKRSGCALLVANGRISDRAAPRYERLRWFFRRVLALPDRILAGDDISLARYLAIGAPPEKVQAGGNLKYDFRPRDAAPPEPVRALLNRLRPREVWIAASTMPPVREGDPDEDAAVVDAFRESEANHPGLLLILAPRKPERFDAVAGLLRKADVRFLRRASLEQHDAPAETQALENGAVLPLPAVLLLDSIGELSSLFAVADVVFMGGTLAHRGGHNILEPAFFGRPVIAGPHMENFPEIASKFSEAGAVYSISSQSELAGAVDALLRSRELRERLGRRARELAQSERGAAARITATIAELYWRALPRYMPAAAARAVLWPLSRLWLAGAYLKRLCGLARRERLKTPVISVGGLTAGGVGKTPFVLWLARALKDRSWRPAILTRGYRRKMREHSTIFMPGEPAPVERTGDEAQLYVRAAAGPVGIGADRAAAGREIEKRVHLDVFLLDDGFQHHRLVRTLDIVLLDALDPFGGGEPVPLGRLREPPGALKRADIVVITRAESGQRVDAIEAVVRRYNKTAPVFTARVVPTGWADAATGEPAQAPPGVIAFCSLGNPDAFWRSLAGLKIQPVRRVAFPDHHRYTLEELRTLASGGAEALLTTQKDVMNLPVGWNQAIAPARLLWLGIRLEVDQDDALLAAVAARLSGSMALSP